MDFYEEIIRWLRNCNPSKKELFAKKLELCKKYKLKKTPTDIQILLHASQRDFHKLHSKLITKPGRTASGVAPIAVMTAPRSCPHGRCAYCPGGPDSYYDAPQSYTGKEPATMRALRNDYDPYMQVFNRLEQYIALGQIPSKAEIIIMGGTFPSCRWSYQKSFVAGCFKALSDFGNVFMRKGKVNIIRYCEFFEMPGSIRDVLRIKRVKARIAELKGKHIKLKKEQRRNESATIRCVGLTIETRPDYATLKHANRMLELGCTRVELGVQSVYDDVLNTIGRGHDVRTTKRAFAVLKDLGFKINAHYMLGLPGCPASRDKKGLLTLFEDPDFRPDMLKLYPCLVIKGTRLYTDWKAGRYKALTTEKAVRLIASIKEHIPPYVRIMRVQRDIPCKEIVAGPARSNLRQLVAKRMAVLGKRCRCIRCREIGRHKEIRIGEALRFDIKVHTYEASNGTEFFIEAVLPSSDILLGFCRLRFPSRCLRPEITKKSALVRELHVYGPSAAFKSKGVVQHKGIGKNLLKVAERIALQKNKNKILVISGIGVRAYYRKLGYRLQGPYMIKKL